MSDSILAKLSTIGLSDASPFPVTDFKEKLLINYEISTARPSALLRPDTIQRKRRTRRRIFMLIMMIRTETPERTAVIDDSHS